MIYLKYKDISEALNKYYEIASSDPTRHSNILEAYSNSLYYSSNTGLTEESLAYFLISSERTRIIKIKKKYIKKIYKKKIYKKIRTGAFAYLGPLHFI